MEVEKSNPNLHLVLTNLFIWHFQIEQTASLAPTFVAKVEKYQKPPNILRGVME